MTAAHFAAALAIKPREPRASTAALIVGAFIPDFIWIGLAAAGVEPTKRDIFFDDRSHSLLSIAVYALLFALAFRSRGRAVMLAMGAAVASHFVLDFPVHPKDLALYPHSTVHLGIGLSGIPVMDYWLVQLAVVLLLLGAYVAGARRLRVSGKAIAASCALVLGWHVALIPG